MWSELLDLAMQDATIELAAAFVLVTASWAIVSATIRTAYRLRSRRKRTLNFL
jgi:large-conductance mechanosensitive channel